MKNIQDSWAPEYIALLMTNHLKLEGFERDAVAGALRRALQGCKSIHLGAATPIPVVAAPAREEMMDPNPGHFEQPVPSALNMQIGGAHYKNHKIQHVQFCQQNQLTWCESSAMKYLMRHREKNGVQDVDKAIHYCLLLREIEYPDAPKPVWPTASKS